MFSLSVFLTTGLVISLLVSLPIVEDFLLPSAVMWTGSSYPSITDRNFSVQVITNDIEFPTAIDFIDGNILVLEKNSGLVKRIEYGNTQSEPLLHASVLNQSERGMLGVATTKDQTHTKVFLFFTEGGEDGAHNRVYKYDLANNKLVHPELILDLPGEPGARHNGGVIKIGPDDHLYVTIGDVNDGEDRARNQDTEEMIGIAGIIRINQDGNGLGILGDEYPLNLYYAYGIRNSFGIDFDPVTGYLWDTENGDRNNDEINLVQPGFNSGFNQIQGMSYENKFNPHNLVKFDRKGNYSDPKFVWNYSVSPTAVKFLTSDKYGLDYQNDLFVGDFNNGYLYHFDLNENRSGLKLSGPLEDRVADAPHELEDVIFGRNFGPITDIRVGPDGFLYVLSLSQTDDESGRNCRQDIPFSQCLKYSNPAKGTLFRIVPTRSS
jgi:glucose/arabinose dehydrogenase